MLTKNGIRILCLVACLALGESAFAVAASTSSEATDSTSGSTGQTTKSTKSLFSLNEQQKVEKFVAENFDRLQEQAARGSGVLLNDYVSLLGCQNPNNTMNQAIKKNYSRLFNAGKDQLLPQTEKMIQDDSSLVSVCETRS